MSFLYKTLETYIRISGAYSHTVVTPVIVVPGNPRVIPLEPSFITPQDGHEKQDCENAASKRWLSDYGARYSALGVTILGDDLYCKQPLCEAFIREGMNYILVCKPDSHKTLYEWVAELATTGDVQTIEVERRKGKHRYIDTYRFVSKVPLPPITRSPKRMSPTSCATGAPAGRWRTKTTTR